MSAGPRQLHVRMRGRSVTESHRASSPLELLFDLTFVVAISSLAAQLAQHLLHGDVGALVPYLMVFFAIWWAWMNFTWFGSAYDTDDVPYRVFALVQMAGVLVLAAGVPAAFEHSQFLAITLGYVIMRIGLVANWVRAAVEHPESRRTTLRYAGGVALVQVGWVLRAFVLPPEIGTVSFVVLALLDLSVPPWAERTGHTSWHPGHVAERYGLFVIILLGESVAAATGAMQKALASTGVTPALVTVGAAGLALLFAIWWIYFLEPAERGLTERPHLSYFWGYGHWFLFAAIAAVGSGLEVAVDAAAHAPKIGPVAVGYAAAVPVAVLFVLLYVLHRPLVDRAEVPAFVLLPAAALVLLAPLAAPAVGVSGEVVLIALIAGLVVAGTIAAGQSRRG